MIIHSVYGNYNLDFSYNEKQVVPLVTIKHLANNGYIGDITFIDKEKATQIVNYLNETVLKNDNKKSEPIQIKWLL